MASQSKHRAARKQRGVKQQRRRRRRWRLKRRQGVRRALHELKGQVQKVVQKADSLAFYNLLSSPQLLEKLESLLPQYRERKYPPLVTLAMFLGQVLSADASLQKVVN